MISFALKKFNFPFNSGILFIQHAFLSFLLNPSSQRFPFHCPRNVHSMLSSESDTIGINGSDVHCETDPIVQIIQKAQFRNLFNNELITKSELQTNVHLIFRYATTTLLKIFFSNPFSSFYMRCF